MDEIRRRVENSVMDAATLAVQVLSESGCTLSSSEHPAAIKAVVLAFSPLVEDLSSKAVQLEIFRDELFAVATALGVTQPRLVPGELAPIVTALRVEVEQAKADRNRSGVEERRKYLPHLEKFTNDFKKLAVICDGNGNTMAQETLDETIARITARVEELNDFSAMMRQPSPQPVVTYQPIQKTPHLCPKCRGQKIVSMPPHVAGDVEFFTSEATGYPCQICNGEGVLWQ